MDEIDRPEVDMADCLRVVHLQVDKVDRLEADKPVGLTMDEVHHPIVD